MMKKTRILFGHLSVAVLLLFLGWLRLMSPNLSRPFENDELLTVRCYTWVGSQPSGEMQRMNHIEDIYALKAPSVRQLAMGAYCSMGRWTEPNNHVVNSLLINLSTCVAGRDERAARLPALFGGLVFAGAMYFLCSCVLQWRAAAPLLAIWAWFLPYVVRYSQTARGYTWMLAIEVIMIIMAYLMARTARSVALGSLCVVAGVLSLMNMVSMAVDWLLPYYLALLLVRPHETGLGGDVKEQTGGWRVYVLVQALCVGGMGFLFFMSHLAGLISSAQKYGLEFHSANEFLELTCQVGTGLFPTVAAQILAAAGVVGLVALHLSRRAKFLSTLVLLVFVVSLLHYALGRRFPYPRAAGHFIPLVLLGAAYLVERAVRFFGSSIAQAIVFGTIAVPTAAMAALNWHMPQESQPLRECLEIARRVELPPGSRCYIKQQQNMSDTLWPYCPRQWSRIDVVPPDIKLNLAIFSWDPYEKVRLPGLTEASGYGLTVYSGETRSLSAADVPSNAWIFWYPEFTLLGINGKDQEDYVRDSGCLAVPQYTRYQVKFEVYGYLQCYLFPPDERSGKVADVVREGIRRFGGRGVVFVPASSRVYQATEKPLPEGI
jgi:hypothetical protein